MLHGTSRLKDFAVIKDAHVDCRYDADGNNSTNDDDNYIIIILNFKTRTTLKLNYTNSPELGADSFLTASGDAVTAGGTKFCSGSPPTKTLSQAGTKYRLRRLKFLYVELMFLRMSASNELLNGDRRIQVAATPEGRWNVLISCSALASFDHDGTPGEDFSATE